MRIWTGEFKRKRVQRGHEVKEEKVLTEGIREMELTQRVQEKEELMTPGHSGCRKKGDVEYAGIREETCEREGYKRGNRGKAEEGWAEVKRGVVPPGWEWMWLENQWTNKWGGGLVIPYEKADRC